MDRRLPIAGIMACTLFVQVAGALLADSSLELAPVFQHWETVSGQRGREGMLVRALQPVIGPLRQDCLVQRFSWSRVNDQEIVAVPRDDAERMFAPQVRIQVDESGMPTQVTVGQLTQDVRDMAQVQLARFHKQENSAGTNQIVTVSFEDVPAAKPIHGPLSRVLTKWCAASQQAVAVRTTFKRVDYDLATEIEFHSTGEFIYSAPRLGYYRTVPTIRPESTSNRLGIHGTPFVQQPGEAIQHYWTDRELVQIESQRKAYFVYPLPATGRDGLGSGSFDNLWRRLMAPQNALPFVVGLSEKELRSEYEWRLVSESTDSIILDGAPVSGPDQAHLSQVQIIIDAKTWRTRATRIVDVGRTHETIHEFFDQSVSRNPRDLGDWQPDLTGFVRANDLPGVGQVPPVEPASAQTSSPQ